jgi:hypothetical protein
MRDLSGMRGEATEAGRHRKVAGLVYIVNALIANPPRRTGAAERRVWGFASRLRRLWRKRSPREIVLSE